MGVKSVGIKNKGSGKYQNNSSFSYRLHRFTLSVNQYVKWSGNIYGLIVTSLLFGMSHYDLGFSFGVCIAFSIGGFFMGGAALRSKGIVSPILMHIYMNLIFVMTGMIFS